ncbi:TPA: EpsG family protein, partial [Haemophilus influenzae]
MFFTVFRYGVGEEYFQYEELFKQVLPINKISISYFKDNVHDIEYGYLFFESVIKYFSDEHLVFLVFYVFAMFLFLYKAINNTGLYRNIQLLIFYSFIFLEYIFSVHRQGVAMCIIYYAIILMIHEDKLFRYTLLVILASLFHKIAIILIPLHFFIRKEFKVSVLFYMVVIALFISSFDLIGIVIKWCNENFSNVAVFRRVFHYYFNKHDENLKMSAIPYMQRAIMLFILFLFYKRIPYTYSNLLLLYVSLFFIFSNVGVLANRVSGILLVSYAIFFSVLICNLKFKRNRLLIILYMFFL